MVEWLAEMMETHLVEMWVNTMGTKLVVSMVDAMVALWVMLLVAKKVDAMEYWKDECSVAE